MNWKKVAESEDLIVFEKETKDSKIKIEARKTEELVWEVYKIKVNGESTNLVSEYTLDNKNQVKELIKKLKNEEDISSRHIRKITKKPTSSITLNRAYKEEFVEKWHFFVGTEKIRNVVVIKYDDIIQADVVMHEKYQVHEKNILSQLEEKLGLKDFGDTVEYDIYYFRKHAQAKTKSSSFEYSFNFVDVDFFPPEDEDES